MDQPWGATQNIRPYIKDNKNVKAKLIIEANGFPAPAPAVAEDNEKATDESRHGEEEENNKARHEVFNLEFDTAPLSAWEKENLPLLMSVLLQSYQIYSLN